MRIPPRPCAGASTSSHFVRCRVPYVSVVMTPSVARALLHPVAPGSQHGPDQTSGSAIWSPPCKQLPWVQLAHIPSHAASKNSSCTHRSTLSRRWRWHRCRARWTPRRRPPLQRRQSHRSPRRRRCSALALEPPAPRPRPPLQPLPRGRPRPVEAPTAAARPQQPRPPPPSRGSTM